MMNWNNLLNDTRTRVLMGGPTTTRMASEPRDEFERDYGRVIFSTPLRRLQDKTQVFPMDPNDSVRTRLTHSLEVSSVARTLGRLVGDWLRNEGYLDERRARFIETITATCGLIHDLGNPPFGHAGESAIQTWFLATIARDPDLADALESSRSPTSQFYEDFARFEGNAQTLRILSRLQVLADTQGLNLTSTAFSVACKYVAPSDGIDPTNHAMRKPGFFASETEIVRRVRELLATGDARHPLTYLVEAADDSVYSVVDIEDAVKKGILTWSEVTSHLAAHASSPSLTRAFDGAQRILKNATISPLHDDSHANAFKTAAISEFVSAALDTFQKRHADILAGQYAGELLADPDCEARLLIGACKALAKTRVYQHPEILKLELLGKRVLHDLLDIFWEGGRSAPSPKPGTFAHKAYSLLSTNYKAVFHDSMARRPADIPEMYYRLQLVTDYIAGMTDTFATNLHRRLVNG